MMRGIAACTLPAQSFMWRHLTQLDGRPFASAGFTHDGGDIWQWMVETVSQELECSPDEVHVLETDDGDVITVDGLPVYKIHC